MELFLAPARAIAAEPKLVLPLVLNWVPQFALLLLVSAFLAANPALLEPRAALALLEGASLEKILLASLPPIALIAAAWLAGAVASAFVSLTYADLYSQVVKQKKIRLAGAFDFAKTNFVRYLSAAILLWALVATAVVLAGLLALAAMQALPGAALAFLLLFLGALVVAAVAAASVLYFVFPPVVGFGKAGGLQAIRECLAFGKKNPAEVIVAAVVVAVVSSVAGAIGGAFASLPLLGYALAQLLYLPINAWASMVPVALYLEKL